MNFSQIVFTINRRRSSIRLTKKANYQVHDLRKTWVLNFGKVSSCTLTFPIQSETQWAALMMVTPGCGGRELKLLVKRIIYSWWAVCPGLNLSSSPEQAGNRNTLEHETYVSTLRAYEGAEHSNKSPFLGHGDLGTSWNAEIKNRQHYSNHNAYV